MSAAPPQSHPPKPSRVFTIPAGLSFVDVLAAGILARMGGDPAALARITVLVPTRRAKRSLAEAFLRRSEGRPLLLPRMTALGDLDEDEILLAGGFGAEDGSLDIKPAVPGLKRQLMLARLVLARDPGTSPDQAVNLALALARLLDQVATERLSFDGLADLVPDAFAEHWQRTLEFLKVLTESWPGILDEEAAVDAAERRNRLLDAQAKAWTENPPADPVIAAGSTGSIPATADLLAVVAGLPGGAVVLPGLDRELPDAAWEALGEHHPQYLMARLLKRLGCARADVKEWEPDGEGPSPRARLMAGALAPGNAPVTVVKKDAKAALAGLTRVDCPGPREEAAVIALVMRRTLEEPGKTAALVTPDRALARRVAAELGRWDVAIDDSAGVPLAQTRPGAFLRLTARMAADALAPISLLAALKHPLATGGQAPGGFRARVRELEIATLRGPRPAPGIEGLMGALKTSRGLDKKTITVLRAFLKDLKKTISPFAKTLQGKPKALPDVVTAHVKMAEALAATAEAEGTAELWAGDAGEAAANFVNELLDAAKDFGAVTGADYPALLETLMAGRAVRPRFGRHPRLHIWGLLEARLQRADVMILGGLNENTWPPEAKASPWMSRPMLKDFGLPPPERHLGQTAHDFAQAFSAPDVVLTRATRVDGTPTVASPWLLRLDNLLERLGLKKGDETPFAAAEPWLAWTEALDRPAEKRQVAEPRPTPPVKDRPRQLSVTQVEHWIRDPYAIYARHVLGLDPLSSIDDEPGAADRGIIIHAVLHEFLELYGDALPGDAERRLLDIGRKVFNDSQVPPGVDAFWWPRFERIAAWFIDYERARREAGFRNVAAESKGKMVLDGPAGPFTLTARADRIDHRADIGLAVMDYKTGAPPTTPQVEAGFSPQLPLEAAIAQSGGFETLKAEPTAQLVYLHLTGGRVPGREKPLKLDVQATVENALQGLADLIAAYDDPAMPYLSQPRPMLLERAGDYDHLARVLEWRGRAEDGP